MSKKINLLVLLAMGLIATFFQSCKDDDDDDYATYSVLVQLSYPDGYDVAENVVVTLTSSDGTTYTDSTDTNGITTFGVPVEIYDVSVSERRTVSGKSYNFTGSKSVTLTDSWNETDTVSVDLSVSEAAALIIKELYIGGCQDTSGTFSKDKYVILYNNSEDEVSLDNVCLAYAYPYNSNSTNHFYENGTLSYESEGWIPAGTGIWYFPDGITLASGEQIVVALYNAIDNTETYENSVNFANAEYYCTYDIDVFTLTSYYPAPSSLIPTSHYLSAVRYGAAKAWAISNSSPAFYIFATEDETPKDYASSADNQYSYNGSSTSIYLKIPTDWIIDGIEVYRQGYDNQKRLTADIDAGYVYHTNKQGYTLYRNVDQTATEALDENSGKIVYNYSGGTTDVDDGSTDKSGIDAEASEANGARIIYSDTNSSTTDFHQRAKASLRD